ncbi:flagellin modification protein A [Helicobacter enhydrae]|uniref:Flagellin modification protein A n=1 Tax=Helicobacter enhydrae TaxID=222136 RepID=A0A1B1U5L6_9HELI|nr:oxidoreductase [Helicobacter enhydrae]ANV98021.1 flagellin modification protein A [Helicobacter enhydrae]
MLLKDKIVIITGGAGLIGKSLCQAIIQNGGIAVIADISQELGEKAQHQIDPSKEHSLFVEMDITAKESIASAIAKIHQEYGKIDALVNNAYPRTKLWGKNDFYHFDFEDFCQNLKLQLGGYVLTSQQFALYFKKQGWGNIISMSSIMGVYAPKFENYVGTDMDSVVDYSIIKAGINHMTRWMAKYLANTGIRVNAIAPGGILANQPQSFLQKYRNCCTNKGMLDPQDLNGTLIYLLSDMSKYVNGQILIVDDGWGL